MPTVGAVCACLAGWPNEAKKSILGAAKLSSRAFACVGVTPAKASE